MLKSSSRPCAFQCARISLLSKHPYNFEASALNFKTLALDPMPGSEAKAAQSPCVDITGVGSSHLASRLAGNGMNVAQAGAIILVAALFLEPIGAPRWNCIAPLADQLKAVQETIRRRCCQTDAVLDFTAQGEGEGSSGFFLFCNLQACRFEIEARPLTSCEG